MTQHTASAEETYAYGARLASCLRPGDVVVLTGNLGAGKTALVRGIASGMDVKSQVSSPTFTLLHLHQPGQAGGVALHHFDVYRLDGPDDFIANGLDEYLGGESIALIEWGDRVREALPDRIIEIDLRYGEGADDRTIRVSFPEDEDRCGT